MTKTGTYRYLCCGLRVQADLPLPGLCERPEEQGAPTDVRIQRGAVPDAPARRAIEGGRGPTWVASGDELLLEVPGVVRFQLAAGGGIVYEPAPGRTPHDFAAFLMGSAFGALLHQRGCLVLHGSAIETGGGAALFCGVSGIGKSSLAAALSAAGYPLIADDMCAIRFGEGAPTLPNDGRSLKLWADAAGHLKAATGEQVRRGIGKYWVTPAASHVGGGAIPVRRIYFLRDAQPPHAAGIERLSAVDGAELLQRAAYRRRLIRVLGQEAHWLQQSVQLLGHAEAFWFTRERRLEALPESVAMLNAHWNAQPEASHAAA